MRCVFVAILWFSCIDIYCQQQAEFFVKKKSTAIERHGLLVLPKYDPKLDTNVVWIDSLFGFADTVRLTSGNLSIKSFFIGWRSNNTDWAREINGDIVDDDFARLLYDARRNRTTLTLGYFQCIDTAGVNSTFKAKYLLRFR